MITRMIRDPTMLRADDRTRIRGLMMEGFSKPTFAGSRLTPRLAFVCGYVVSSCFAKLAATGCVFSMSNPGRRRPNTSSEPPPRP